MAISLGTDTFPLNQSELVARIEYYSQFTLSSLRILMFTEFYFRVEFVANNYRYYSMPLVLLLRLQY